jgi:hypothetical protein
MFLLLIKLGAGERVRQCRLGWAKAQSAVPTIDPQTL